MGTEHCENSLPNVSNEPRDVRDLQQRDDRERAAHAIAIKHTVHEEVEAHEDHQRDDCVDCKRFDRDFLCRNCNRKRYDRHDVHVVVEHHRGRIAERYESKRSSTRFHHVL